MAFANTFDALNAKSIQLGFRIFEQLMEEKDVEGVRRIIADTEKMYAGIITFIENRYDYAAWYKYFIETNVNSCMNDLDRTGEYARIVEEMKTVDAEGYYFSVIRPIIQRGVVPIYQEREVVLGQLKGVLSMVIAERRRSFEVVN